MNAQAEVLFTTPLYRVREGVRVVLTHVKPPEPVSKARPIRAARLLALAHQLQLLVDAGERPVDLATRLGFSRARVSQILDLTLLAPDLQARVLFMTTLPGEADPIHEHQLRRVVRHALWADQRAVFAGLMASGG